MAYSVRIVPTAAKQFEKLDRPTKTRIDKFLTKLTQADNPRAYGKALHGELSDLWSYRVGDYRLLSRIEDQTLTVLVVKFAHRRQVYK